MVWLIGKKIRGLNTISDLCFEGIVKKMIGY